MPSRGKCKPGKHKIVRMEDGEKRSFYSCEICGNTPIKNLTKEKK